MEWQDTCSWRFEDSNRDVSSGLDENQLVYLTSTTNVNVHSDDLDVFCQTIPMEQTITTKTFVENSYRGDIMNLY